jgi:hypothetical protein
MKATRLNLSKAALIVLALSAAFFLISAHSRPVDEQRALAPHHLPQFLLGTNDHYVLADMYAYAAMHFDTFHELPETFSVVEDWSHAWTLHWIDVEADGRIVRIYHASAKANPHQRFVSTWDEPTPHWSNWQPIHSELEGNRR